MDIKHRFKVIAGTIYLDDKELFQKELEGFEGASGVLILREDEENPTAEMHAYYRKVCLDNALSTGQYSSKEEAHYDLKKRFLLREKIIGIESNKQKKLYEFLGSREEIVDLEIAENAVTIKFIPSLADLGKKEMSDFIERVQAFLISQGMDEKAMDTKRLFQNDENASNIDRGDPIRWEENTDR